MDTELIKLKKKQTLWPLFMDGVQLPQDYSHFEEAVYMDTNISNLILKLTIATYLMKKKKIDFVILKMNDLIDFRKLIDIFRIQQT